jgi:hypothetical protein
MIIDKKSITKLERTTSIFTGTVPTITIGVPRQTAISNVLDPKILETAPDPFPFLAAETAMKVSEIDVPNAKISAETTAIEIPKIAASSSPVSIIPHESAAIAASPPTAKKMIFQFGR